MIEKPNRSRPFKPRERSFRPPREKSEFEEKLLDLARVTRVVAGGKRFRFRALVAVGDRKGQVGVGMAKGADVSQAISKAAYQAKRKIVRLPMVKGTIPREIKVKYKSALIYLRPAPRGRGINAGGAVRVISDLAGLKDVVGKTLSRSTNKINTARAAIEAFRQLAATTQLPKSEARPPRRDESRLGNPKS